MSRPGYVYTITDETEMGAAAVVATFTVLYEAKEFFWKNKFDPLHHCLIRTPNTAAYLYRTEEPHGYNMSKPPH